MEHKALPIKALVQNKGQIEGLPVNPRQWTAGEVETLAASIQQTPELLEARGIVVTPLPGKADKYIILGGNMRYDALKKLKAESAPCIIIPAGTPVEKLKEIVIKDNGAFGSWDYDMLANEWDDLPLTEWGVPAWNADAAVEPAEPLQASEDDFNEDTDAIPARCAKGDLWQLGDHRLMCGDSTNPDDLAKLMDGESGDMVLTDPPYGISVVGDNGEVGANFGIAKKGNYSKVIADDTTETAKSAIALLLPMAKKHIVWGGNYFTDFLPFSDGWVIWDKRGESGIRNTFADGEMAWCSFHTPIRIYHQLWNGMIREGEHEKRVHPTQKPVRMLGEILNDYTEQGNAIIDVFGGSGSTMMAAEQLGRKCYMMELDPHYCDVILARWEKLTGRQAERITPQNDLPQN